MKRGRPPFEKILGLVFRSNPRIEEMIYHELQHGKQPGNDANLEFLHQPENRDTLLEAYRSSRVGKLLNLNEGDYAH